MFELFVAREFSGDMWTRAIRGIVGRRLQLQEAPPEPVKVGPRHGASYRAARRNHARRHGLIWRQQPIIARNGVAFVVV